MAASRARPNVAEGRGAKPSPPPQAKENKSKAPLAPKRRREESEVEEEEEEDVGRRGRAADNGRKKAHPSPAAAPARSSPVPSRPSKPIIVTPRVADRRERPSDVDTRRQEHSRPDAVHPRAGVNALLGLDSLGDGNDDLQLMSTVSHRCRGCTSCLCSLLRSTCLIRCACVYARVCLLSPRSCSPSSACSRESPQTLCVQPRMKSLPACCPSART